MMIKIWATASAALLALDRLSKYWAQTALQAAGEQPLWPGVLGLVYARNTGVAFSMGKQVAWLVPVLTALMIGVVLVIFFRDKSLAPFTRGALLLVAAGGLGNLTDRLLYGYVVDFIEFQFMNFAIFNLADVMICVGAGLAVVGLVAKGGVSRDVDG